MRCRRCCGRHVERRYFCRCWCWTSCFVAACMHTPGRSRQKVAQNRKHPATSRALHPHRPLSHPRWHSTEELRAGYCIAATKCMEPNPPPPRRSLLCISVPVVPPAHLESSPHHRRIHLDHGPFRPIRLPCANLQNPPLRHHQIAPHHALRHRRRHHPRDLRHHHHRPRHRRKFPLLPCTGKHNLGLSGSSAHLLAPLAP
mmetsp:Transcript_6977/g.13843  ORF Transcript_6977/g.13843 Transcript_6977/m.13843 type:complete len:200 (-) Transcript_6977:270-869(-)